MIKKNLHPLIYKTKIFCNNQLILELETTKPELAVELWSGNHPFYTGYKKILDTEGRIKKFEKKFKNIS